MEHATASSTLVHNFVTQMLRQGDANVFKRYSHAKLNMKREALNQLDRQANEHDPGFWNSKAELREFWNSSVRQKTLQRP